MFLDHRSYVMYTIAHTSLNEKKNKVLDLFDKQKREDRVPQFLCINNISGSKIQIPVRRLEGIWQSRVALPIPRLLPHSSGSTMTTFPQSISMYSMARTGPIDARAMYGAAAEAGAAEIRSCTDGRTDGRMDGRKSDDRTVDRKR